MSEPKKLEVETDFKIKLSRNEVLTVVQEEIIRDIEHRAEKLFTRSLEPLTATTEAIEKFVQVKLQKNLNMAAESMNKYKADVLKAMKGLNKAIACRKQGVSTNVILDLDKVAKKQHNVGLKLVTSKLELIHHTCVSNSCSISRQFPTNFYHDSERGRVGFHADETTDVEVKAVFNITNWDTTWGYQPGMYSHVGDIYGPVAYNVKLPKTLAEQYRKVSEQSQKCWKLSAELGELRRRAYEDSFMKNLIKQELLKNPECKAAVTELAKSFQTSQLRQSVPSLENEIDAIFKD